MVFVEFGGEELTTDGRPETLYTTQYAPGGELVNPVADHGCHGGQTWLPDSCFQHNHNNVVAACLQIVSVQFPIFPVFPQFLKLSKFLVRSPGFRETAGRYKSPFWGRESAIVVPDLS